MLIFSVVCVYLPMIFVGGQNGVYVDLFARATIGNYTQVKFTRLWLSMVQVMLHNWQWIK
jgi:hypothetical protein